MLSNFARTQKLSEFTQHQKKDHQSGNISKTRKNPETKSGKLTRTVDQRSNSGRTESDKNSQKTREISESAYFFVDMFTSDGTWDHPKMLLLLLFVVIVVVVVVAKCVRVCVVNCVCVQVYVCIAVWYKLCIAIAFAWQN